MNRLLSAAVLSAALLLPASALARDATPPPPPVQPGFNATDALKNPSGTVEALNRATRESQAQNQAAINALQRAQQGGSAPGASTQRPGGGKVIYGDIIIHK